MIQFKQIIFLILIIAAISGCEKFNQGAEIPIVTTDTTLVKMQITTHFNDAGAVVFKDTIKYTYDAAHRLIYRWYNANSMLFLREQYTYNTNDTIKEVSLRDLRATGTFHYLYSYSGNQVIVDMTDSVGAPVDKYVFTLDAKMRPLTRQTDRDRYIYTHDSNGNMVDRIVADKNGTSVAWHDTYAYDNKKHPQVNMPANLQLNYLAEYGTKATTANNLVKWEEDGNAYQDYTYTYNSKGYATKAGVSMYGKYVFSVVYFY
jgi:hypothetical protein